MPDAHRTRARSLLAVGAAVGVLAAGGVAYAAIPSSDGVITACYLKSGGALRVIDAISGKCRNTETRLSWNVAGVPGVDGQDGANGADGRDGADGQDGVSGYEVVSADWVFDEGTTAVFASHDADCPAGKKVLGGGGVFIESDGTPISASRNTIDATYPKADGSGWWVQFEALNIEPDGVVGIRAFATCASVG